MELDKRGAGLLFQVLTEPEEKNGVAIASSESFPGWTKTFAGPRLCAEIVAICRAASPAPRPAAGCLHRGHNPCLPAATSRRVDGWAAAAKASVSLI
jgi:hypothetical protein